MEITKIVSVQEKEKMVLIDIESNKNVLSIKKIKKTKKIDKNNIEKEIIDFIRNNAEVVEDIDDLNVKRVQLAIKNKRSSGNFLITSIETSFSDYKDLNGFKDFDGKIYKTEFLPKNEMIIGYINDKPLIDINIDAGIVLNEKNGLLGFLPNSVYNYYTVIKFTK